MAPAIANVLATMQLVCNIVMPGIPGVNNTSTVLPNGYVAYPDIDTAYKVHTDVVTWDEARERCLEEDAHLAVIDTTLKISYVINPEPATDEVLVGIHSMYNGTKWVSATEDSDHAELVWGVRAPGDPAGLTHCVVMEKVKRGLVKDDCNTKGYCAVC